MVFKKIGLLVYLKQETGERGLPVMKSSNYDQVCYFTEQREEHLPIRNLKSGEIGYTFGCTYDGNTIQVRLENGELDSWAREDCTEVTETSH